ncbi:MAG: 3-deoxy-manno-octulosonate cytidylyltransferase [Alphaproteobacteria bacterium]|nr:3-deoxy-manno-octulosonate cytidylyltransferase [Alphaproteobacteria bacterium]
MKTVVIIPCRMKSERLPNKPLIDINGKTLIQRVYENVSNVFGAQDTYVACDDLGIKAKVEELGAKAIMTDPDCPSGTDRIAQALKTIDPDGSKYDVVINFQGDDVNVDPTICGKLVELMATSGADIATVVQPIVKKEEIENPNIVKVATAFDKGSNTARCLYFSRSPLPYNRPLGTVDEAFWHIGIYVYNAKSLQKFVSLPVGLLEAREKLEQLRALENGMSIFALKVEDTRIDKRAPADVNTPQDYEEMIKFVK